MSQPGNSLTTEQIAEFLSTTDLFEKISIDVLTEMAKEFKIMYLAGDEVLFHQNELADSLYLVMYGFLHVLKEQSDGKKRIIAELGSGSAVGEIACLVDVTRTATIYAVRDSILLQMTRQVFDGFLQKYPMAMMGVARQSVERLIMPVNHAIKSRISCFTLIPSSNFSGIESFSQLFVEKLSHYGETLLLNEAQFDKIHGKGSAQTSLDSAKSAEIISWIHTLESTYRYIVYVASETGHWAARCLRQADKIILVAQYADSTRLNDLERSVFVKKSEKPSNVELVILADSSLKFASGTSNWFAQRHISQHYNLRMDRSSDISRFIRLVSGHGLGLVLSGGGATALAHLGVIRAIEELEIPLDYIAGTSMGALIGGVLALDLDYRTLVQNIERVFREFSSHVDYTLPVSAMLKAKVLKNLMRDSYGEDTKIEDLWQKYFCVSTNISTSEIAVHDHSLLWKAIRSSISLPGVFPAVHDEFNRIHVDGGILNNLPVDVMKERINGGKIIASSLKINQKISSQEYEEDTTSGWYLFVKHKLLPRLTGGRERPKKTFIPIERVILDSMLLGSNKHQEAMVAKADYNVLIDIKSYGLLNFKPLREIMDIGYRQALIALDHSDLKP